MGAPQAGARVPGSLDRYSSPEDNAAFIPSQSRPTRGRLFATTHRRTVMVWTASDLRRVFQKNEIHESWETVYRRDRSQQLFNERLLARILGQLALPVGSSVLDAGCGTGEHTLRLAGFGFSCVGVDLSRPVLERAKERAQAAG